MPSPLTRPTRPLGNEYDRTRGFLNIQGPSATAGQYTSNPSGSQTLQRDQALIMNTPGLSYKVGGLGKEEHLARVARVQAGNGLGQDFQLPVDPVQQARQQHQIGQIDAVGQQRMNAIGGSPGYQQGLAGDPDGLAQAYRQQHVASFAGTPGGEQMVKRFSDIQRAQAVAALPNGISPAGLRTSQQNYGADLATNQQALTSGFAEGSPAYTNADGNEVRRSPNGYGVVDRGEAGVGRSQFALTTARDPNRSQSEDLLRGNQQANLEDPNTQLRGMKTAIRRGVLNKAAVAYMAKEGLEVGDYLKKDGSLDKDKLKPLVVSTLKKGALDRSSSAKGKGKMNPDGTFKVVARTDASKDNAKLETPVSVADKADADTLASLKLSKDSSYEDFKMAIRDPEYMDRIVSMPEGDRYSVARAFARQLRNNYKGGGGVAGGDKFISKGGGLLTGLHSGDTTGKHVEKAVDLDLTDPKAVNEWFHSWVAAVYNQQSSLQRDITNTPMTIPQGF